MKLTRRNMMIGAAGAMLLPSLPAGAAQRHVGGPAFGSSWRISFAGDVDVDADTVARLVQGVVGQVDARFSPYRRESDLSRFNASPETAWQSADPALTEVAGEALRMARLTEGYFDPTVGPLVARQGFGPISGGPVAVEQIETGAGHLRKGVAEATLDLCGIAKGYALDRIVAEVRAAGAGPAIVDIGGEVRATAPHPDGRPWVVAVSDPLTPGQARVIVAPGDLALATSGHAMNGVAGRVSTTHIIDPRRRRPATGGLLSVSVLDPSGARADALATALCAAGAAAGPDLARRLDVPALFLFEGRELTTGGFDTRILT